MKNINQLKKEVQVKHALITGEIIQLEKRSENEYVRDEFISIAERIQGEVEWLREIISNLKIEKKIKDVDYFDSFDSDYANKLSWIDYCVLI